MTIKTYKANTNVSINVVLPSKKNLHISFIPLSDGSSIFTTDNADVQKAIESHYNFGKLFRLTGERRTEKDAIKTPKLKAPAPIQEEKGADGNKPDIIEAPAQESKESENPVPATEDGETVFSEEDSETEAEDCEATTDENEEIVSDEEERTPDENESGLRKVKVSDINSAKDYLADTFGISRTAMRSTKSILGKAKENGIEFEGI